MNNFYYFDKMPGFFSTSMWILSIIVLIIFTVAIVRVKNEGDLRIKLLSFIIIFLIALIAQNEWCYLAVIVFIAANTKLISKDLKEALNAFKGFYNQIPPEELEKVESDKYTQMLEDNQLAEEGLKSLNIEQVSYAKYLKEGSLGFKNIETSVIDWVEGYKNIKLERKMKINNKYYPDGICQSNNRDVILEIKVVYGNNLDNIVRASRKIIKQYSDEYSKISKLVDFIYVIVLDKKSSITPDKRCEYSGILNGNLSYNVELIFLYYNTENAKFEIV